MAAIEINISCGLCSNGTRHTVVLPDGWAHRYGGVDDEVNGFCPKHAAAAQFADDQCPGCVGGWGECDMWRAFAYSGERTLTSDDLATLRKGVCPRRTNGTVSLDAGHFSDIDLSEESVSGGKAFADAIEEYVRLYPSPAPGAQP